MPSDGQRCKLTGCCNGERWDKRSWCESDRRGRRDDGRRLEIISPHTILEEYCPKNCFTTQWTITCAPRSPHNADKRPVMTLLWTHLGKVKVTLEQAMKNQRGSGGIAPLFYLGARWRVCGQRHAPATSASIIPDTHCKGAWLGLGDGLDGCREISPPTGIRFPYRPAHCESLYHLLSYPGTYLEFLGQLWAIFIIRVLSGTVAYFDWICALSETNTVRMLQQSRVSGIHLV